MMIDHITVHLHSSALHSNDLAKLLRKLRFREVAPDHAIEKDWDVRWFEPVGDDSTILHLVAQDNWDATPVPGLSHFCVVGIGRDTWRDLLQSKYLEHHSEGSKRLWINYHGLRVEVRP